MSVRIPVWVLLAAFLIGGFTLTQMQRNQAVIRESVKDCARKSGWLSDADCRMMCAGRVR